MTHRQTIVEAADLGDSWGWRESPAQRLFQGLTDKSLPTKVCQAWPGRISCMRICACVEAESWRFLTKVSD